MAKYRSIQTSFWSDSKVVDDFTPDDRYFYLYLLTNAKSNQLGCYELSIKQMCRDTGYGENEIKKLIDRFENELQLINYDFKTKEIFIKNWYKYNWLESENTKKCVEKEFSLIKSSVLKELISPLYAPYKPLPSNKKKKNNKKKNKNNSVYDDLEYSEEQENTPPDTHTQIFNFCLSIFSEYVEKDLEKSCKKFFLNYKSKNWEGVIDWEAKLEQWIQQDIEDGKIQEKRKKDIDPDRVLMDENGKCYKENYDGTRYYI